MCKKIKLLYVVFFVFLFSSLVLLPSSFVYSAVPHLINYQGRLTDKTGKPLEGAYDITFKIYDAETGPGEMAPWEEKHQGLIIQKGIFSVLLGSVTNLDLPFDKSYFLEIKIGDEVMSPRQRIASVGYAIRAEKAEKLINASAIESGVVPTARLGSGTASSSTFLRGDQTWSSVPGRQFFASSGTFTAPAGVTKVFITMVGGGGGGGGGSLNCGADGGGGGAAKIKYPYAVIPGNNYTVIVGSGGSGGAGDFGIGNYGQAGSNSAFDTLTTIAGGGGQFGGGPQGHGTGGGIGGGNVGGDNGLSSTGSPVGTNGANSFYGIKGLGSRTETPGTDATGYGAGGGGGGNRANGGNGTAGFVLVEW